MTANLAWGAKFAGYAKSKQRHNAIIAVFSKAFPYLGEKQPERSILDFEPGKWAGPSFRAPASIAHSEIPRWNLLRMVEVTPHMPREELLRRQYSRAAFGPCLDGLFVEASLPISVEIQEVDGVVACSSPMMRFESLDEMVVSRRPRMVTPVADHQLDRILADTGVVIYHQSTSKVSFAQYLWDGRLYWENSDGAHRFSASRYLARSLKRKVLVKGRLKVSGLNPRVVQSLLHDYSILTIPQCMEADLYDVGVKGNHATYYELKNVGIGEMLYNDGSSRIVTDFIDPILKTNHGEKHYQILFFPKDDAASMRIADQLRTAGSLDLGAYMLKVLDEQEQHLDRFSGRAAFQALCQAEHARNVQSSVLKKPPLHAG